MVLASAEVILFGIQAGVRLYGAARQSYIDKTRERDVTLPLPGLDRSADVGQAQSYFLASGKHHLATNERLRELHGAVMRNRAAFQRDAAASKEYVQAFLYFRAVDSGETKDGLAASDIMALTTISQWKRGEVPHPTALKRIGGTLIEIGVDYFANGPGKGMIAGDAPAKRVLRGVLDSLDDHSFSTEGLDGVIETIFVATIEEIAEDASLVTGDPKLQVFIGAVAKGLVGDINARLQRLSPDQRLLQGDQLGQTAGLVFRSLLRNGAAEVLENPQALLGVEAGAKSELVSRVGTAILDTVLPSAESPIDLTAIVSQEGIDRIVRAGLSVAVEHPELLGVVSGEATGLQTMLLEVAGGLLADSRKLGPDLLPDLMQLVLTRTAANLHLMWEPEGDAEHILASATRTLLVEFAKTRPGGTTWAPAISKSLFLGVAESVLDEIALNPGMVTNRLGDNLPLKVAVEAALNELARIELDEVSGQTVTHIVGVAVRAGAARLDFLDRFKIGSGPTKTAIAHVLDALLTVAFSDDPAKQRASWALAKAGVLEAVTEVAFAELENAGVDADRVRILTTVLDDIVSRLEERKPFSVELFATELRAALAA